MDMFGLTKGGMGKGFGNNNTKEPKGFYYILLMSGVIITVQHWTKAPEAPQWVKLSTNAIKLLLSVVRMPVASSAGLPTYCYNDLRKTVVGDVNGR